MQQGYRSRLQAHPLVFSCRYDTRVAMKGFFCEMAKKTIDGMLM